MIAIALMNFFLATSTMVGMVLIPILCTESLGFSLFVVGIIEGSGEFISNVLRIVNGYLFDRIKNKKILFILSNALALISKLLLLLPTSLSVLLAKITERTANGAFSVPRDAYVGVTAKNSGHAFSYMAMSKALGCVLGPVLVGASTFWWGGIVENLTKFICLCVTLTGTSFIISIFINNIKEDENHIPTIQNIKIKDSINPE